MNTPTPEQIAACMEEAHRLIECSHIDIRPTDAKHLAGDIADALAARDAALTEARKLLAECTILSGDDTDGNTIENGGWVHLWSHAVDAVRQLRADYDEALESLPLTPAPFKVGDRVTAENEHRLPIGTVVRWEGLQEARHATREVGGWRGTLSGLLWPTIVDADFPTYIHSLPTPEKP